MNLDELRTVQSKERQKDSLQHLRPSFYQEVGEYIAALEAERERVADAAEDPFSSPEVGRLTDEIETATDVVEAIYERRMGKLVKQASLAAAGMPADDEGLTAEEADLFEDLVERIRDNKSHVLDVLEGVEAEPVDSVSGSSATAADPGQRGSKGEPLVETEQDPKTAPVSEEREPVAEDEGGVTAAEAMGGDLPADTGKTPPTAVEQDGSDVPPPPPEDPLPADDSTASTPAIDGPSEHHDPQATTDGHGGHSLSESPPDAAAGSQDEGEVGDDKTSTVVDRMTVKITRDVGSILGIDDREYTLGADDVVTLPEENATPLVEREAAEPLE